MDALELLGRDEQFLAPGPALEDVDGGVDPAVRELAREDEFHVAGALELLEDHVVHPRAGVHERGADDGERAALLDGAGAAEEPLRAAQCAGFEAARHRPALPGEHGVVRPREPRNRVEKHDHIASALDEPLRFFEHDLGYLDVSLGLLVEGGGDDLARDVALEVGHLLGPLVDEQDEEVDVGVVLGDRVGDLLEEDGLARLRLRHDEPALPLPDRAEEVHDPRRVLVGRGFEGERLLGEERREVVEVDTVGDGVGLAVVDGVDADEREEALAFLRRADLAVHGVTLLQAEPLDLRGRDVDVVGGGEVVELGRAEETVPVRQDFEHADFADHPFERRLRRVEVAHVLGVLVGEGLPRAAAARAAAGPSGPLFARGRCGVGAGACSIARTAFARCFRLRRSARSARGSSTTWLFGVPVRLGVRLGVGLGVGFEDLVDQVLLAQMRVVRNVEVASDLLQLGDFFSLEGGDVHNEGRTRATGETRRRGRASESGVERKRARGPTAFRGRPAQR